MATFRTIANKLASDLQRDFGLTKEQAIGFVGNLAMESSGFQTLQEISPVVSGSRGGYGYAQWTGPRRVAFESWAKSKNLPVDSYAANYGFIKKELAGAEKDALAALKKADTVEQAARVTMNRYLRPGIPHASARLSWSQKVLDGYAYVPPGDLPGDFAIPGVPGLENIHDRNAAAQGYGEIAPTPATKSANFGGSPVTMSPALAAARQRLTLAREAKAQTAATGATDAAAMSVTPRLTATNGEIDGIEDPRPGLDWAMFRPGVGAEGFGSLLDDRINPATLNPAKPTTMVAGRPDAPIGALPAAQGNTLVAGRPDAPVGSLPAAKPTTSAPGAGLTAAQRNAMSALPTPQPSIIRTGQGIAGTAELPADYKPPAGTIPGNSLSQPKTSSSSSGNALSAPGAGLTQAQKAAMNAVPLASYVAPLKPPASAANTLAPAQVKTTIANPAYAEWVAKYGQDGTQVQTAPTGAPITAAQLAAIQNVNGAVQAPIQQAAPIPPAPPKTITVMKPGNTLSAPSAPVAAPKPQTATTANGNTSVVGQTYSSGGYLYTANADGSFTKIGKVGSTSTSSSNTPSPSTSSTKSTSTSTSSSSSSTSWGAPKTKSDGTSWAA